MKSCSLCFHICRPPSFKKRKSSSTQEYDIDKEILEELRREQTVSKPDEDELFGQSIGATLKTMTPQQKSLAKVRIQQVMYETQYSSVQPCQYYPSDNTAF